MVGPQPKKGRNYGEPGTPTNFPADMSQWRPAPADSQEARQAGQVTLLNLILAELKNIGKAGRQSKKNPFGKQYGDGGGGFLGLGDGGGIDGRGMFAKGKAGTIAHAMHNLSNLFGGVKSASISASKGNLSGIIGGASVAARGAAQIHQAGLSGGSMSMAARALIPVGAAAAVAVFIYELKRAADALIQHRKALGEVSPSMGLVYAQRDIRELFRDMYKGERLAQSTKLLVQNEQAFKDAVLPWEMAWEELKSDFLGGMYGALTEIGEGINKLVDAEKDKAAKDKADAAAGSFSGMVNAAADAAQKRLDDAKRAAKGGK